MPNRNGNDHDSEYQARFEGFDDETIAEGRFPTVTLKFPPDLKLVDEVKARFPRHARRFDPENRAWVIAVESRHGLNALAAMLNANPRFTTNASVVDPDVEAAAAKAEVVRKARQAEHKRSQEQAFTTETGEHEVMLRFPYRHEWVTAIKTLDRAFRRFDESARAWRVTRSPEALEALCRAGEAGGFPPHVMDALKRTASASREAGAATVEDSRADAGRPADEDALDRKDPEMLDAPGEPTHRPDSSGPAM